MSLAFDIACHLAPLARHFASRDYDKSLAYLADILPFRTHIFGPEDQHHGWVIPPKWDVKKACIRQAGKMIYDGTAHPLGVVSHSLPFHGAVDLTELKKHLWYDHRCEEAIPYHFRYSYRPWERNWGLCTPKRLYDSLTEGIYEVEIVTEEATPELKVLDYRIQGSENIEFVFVAHLDHPAAANDGLSGCCAGVELFQRLQKTKTKFSYRLLLVQEIIGSQFYLNRQGCGNIYEALILEMLGAPGPLRVQRSHGGSSMLEAAIEGEFIYQGRSPSFTDFRSLVGNDEIVFESYGIPTASFLRYPPPEYHNDRDSVAILEDACFVEAVDLLENVVMRLECDCFVERAFQGLYCLSNPEINLYVEPGQPTFDTNTAKPMRQLMEHLSLLDKGTFIGQLSRTFDLPWQTVFDYLKQWEAHGLARLR